jgi:hypothetical protein
VWRDGGKKNLEKKGKKWVKRGGEIEGKRD